MIAYFKFIHFNPRTHEECDPETVCIVAHSIPFQSTHSRGVRPIICEVTRVGYNFNPRTHEECDVRLVIGLRVSLIFQSTHSRGVRRRSERFENIFQGISIHALTRSATTLTFTRAHSLPDFNPRTHEECDRQHPSSGPWGVYFNPRTHEECDSELYL